MTNRFKVYTDKNVYIDLKNTIEDAQTWCDYNGGYYICNDKMTKQEKTQDIIWKCINKELSLVSFGTTYAYVKKTINFTHTL